MLRVFLQFLSIFHKLIIQFLFGRFAVTSSPDFCLRIESGQRNELRQDLFQIFYSVFFPDAELYAVCDDELIHFF